MPTNYGISVYRDQFLTQMGWSLMARQGMIAPMIAPLLAVDKPSGKYWLKDPAFSLVDTEYDLEYNEDPLMSGWSLSSDEYDVPLKAISKQMTWKQLAAADSALDLYSMMASDISDQMAIGWEKQVNGELFDKDKWKASSTYKVAQAFQGSKTNAYDNHMFVDFGTGASITTTANSEAGGRLLDIAPAAHWSAATGTSILRDIARIRRIIAKASGHRANVMMMNEGTFEILASSNELRDLYKYTFPGLAVPETISQGTLAGWMGFDRIFVSTIIENSVSPFDGFEGNYVFGGNNVAIMSIPRTSGKWVPTPLRSFNWNGFFNYNDGLRRLQSGSMGLTTWPDQIRKRYVVEGFRPTDVKLISNLMGFVIFNAVK